MTEEMKRIAPFLVASAAILWGGLAIFVRKLNAGGFSAMQIVCLRSYGSVLFLFPGLFLIKKELLRVHVKDCWCFIGTGVFSIVFFSYCYFRNVEVSSVAFSSILMYTSPVWVTLLSAVCFRERITGRKLFLLFLALLGCVLVSGITQGFGTISIYGILLGLGSGIGYGLYTIFGSFALNKGYHPMTVAAYTFLFACMGVIFFVNIPDIINHFTENPVLLLWALGMAFFTTALSFSLYTLGLQYMEPGRAAVLATLEPIVSALVGVFLYDEMMTASMGIGIMLVLASSVLISRE